MKQTFIILAIAVIAAAPIISVSAKGAQPNPPDATIRLISGLPSIMQVGQSYTLTVQITSTEPFRSAKALPDDQYPGKGVVSHGGAQSGAGTSATLNLVFTAKSSTAGLPGGMDSVAVVAGARYPNGQTVSQRFDFSVRVP